LHDFQYLSVLCGYWMYVVIECIVWLLNVLCGYWMYLYGYIMYLYYVVNNCTVLSIIQYCWCVFLNHHNIQKQRIGIKRIYFVPNFVLYAVLNYSAYLFCEVFAVFIWETGILCNNNNNNILIRSSCNIVLRRNHVTIFLSQWPSSLSESACNKLLYLIYILLL